MAARMSASLHTASLYEGWSQGQLPLRQVLGTPDECLALALERAQEAEALGDLPLAETLLRGLCALDARSAKSAEALARVLLARSLSRRDAALLADAEAWARYAAGLDPSSVSIAALVERCRRVRG